MAEGQCRYLRRNGEQCPEFAIDPAAKVLLCLKHAARVMDLIQELEVTKR